MTNADRIAKLARFARRWGGEIRQSTPEEIAGQEWRGFTWCPFGQGLGVHFERKAVLYCDDDTPWYHLLHEAGHVFATLAAPQNSPNELDFLGWEYRMAQILRGVRQWRRFLSTHAYEVEDGGEFGELSTDEQRWVLEEHLAAATAAGLIVNGEPQAIR